MKAMNLTSFGGFIRAGNYGHLALNGPHTLERGVRFEQLTINGRVRASGYRGRHVVVSSGHLVSDGDMTVQRISGHGRMQLRGRLECAAMEFIGELEISRPLICTGQLSVYGSLTSTSQITAQSFTMYGVLEALELHAREALIEPFETKLATRLGMTDYRARSHVKTIHAGTLTARRLNCATLNVDSATLRDGCAVEHAEFIDELAVDQSSSVMMLGKPVQVVSRDGAFRLRQA
ncbi:hypothetical protein [Bifidobacterium sp.]|uniref:hypothetical protein n=1 Tax=Bifidobacterium sp. TaxID=41200 RepID=UPI0025C01703|nr:hypothetical protein [Bifidobacterium sp.]MCH4209221.1 hypothetical protein [Bifidobacterium sp.]MCI1224668.1 hypothetical protein [Bifidobacterium sp.]